MLPDLVPGSYVVGSMCTGYGGLDAGVAEALGGSPSIAWVADIDKDCAQIIAHRMPGVVNLGDIRTVEWEKVAPVDVLVAGFPCQPVSGAGKQKGMADERWIWPYIPQAIGRMAARPRLLVFENVPRLLTIDGGAAHDQVIFSLAEIGYVGRFGLFRASDAGSCHRRERWFLIAYDAHASGLRGPEQPGGVRGPAAEITGPQPQLQRAGHAAVGGGPDAADDPHAVGAGPQGGVPARRRPLGHGQARLARALGLGGAGDQVPADADRRGPGLRRAGSAEPAGREGPAGDGARAAAHPDGQPGVERWRAARGEAPGGWPQRVGGRSGDGDRRAAAADAERHRPQGGVGHDAHPGPAAQAERPQPAAGDGGSGTAAHPADRGGAAWLAQPAPVPWRHDADRPGDPASPGAGSDGVTDAEWQAAEAALTAAFQASDDFEEWCPDEAGRIHTVSGYCCTAAAFLAARVEFTAEELFQPSGNPYEGQVDWAEYEPAIRRWEYVSGRPAPCPVEPGRLGKPRLAARFAEWMMGLPDGWVTGVPGLSRSAQLKAIGNGVVPAQAALAVRTLYGAVQPGEPPARPRKRRGKAEPEPPLLPTMHGVGDDAHGNELGMVAKTLAGVTDTPRTRAKHRGLRGLPTPTASDGKSDSSVPGGAAAERQLHRGDGVRRSTTGSLTKDLLVLDVLGLGKLLPTPEASDATGGRVASELGGTRPSGAKRAITLSSLVAHKLTPPKQE